MSLWNAPCRMVSLLEILEHNAEPFCRLSSILGQAIMIMKQHGGLPENALHELAGSLGELQREAQRLDLVSVNKHIERIKQDLVERHRVPTEGAIEELYNRLRDSLEERFFLAIPSEGVSLYRQIEPLFGREVEDAFSMSAEDISEAGKCLALGRATACVFHFMRAMEAAVGKLAVKLGIANQDREWGKLLSDIAARIEAMPKGPDRNRWSESHTHLYHVKQAWRNETMHPKQTYTAEQAREVMSAVKVFMRHLASLVQ